MDVTAFRWGWTFEYADEDVAVTGLGGPDADGPTIVVPVGEPIQMTVRSNDVIHSLAIPQFLFKRDVIPGIPEGNKGRKFQITTLNKPGVYAGRCAELCGVDHSRMLFSVKLVPQAEFDQYIATQSGSAQ